MKSLLLVMLGSALGGGLRFGMANFFYHHFGKSFPWGTLAVNLLGCFFIGLLFVFILEKFHLYSSVLHNLFIVGFLGGFTTFSAFSFEAASLFENLLVTRGVVYILSSTVGGILLTATGVWLGKKIV